MTNISILVQDRDQARNLGHTHYKGTPCKNGHDGVRYVADTRCKMCLKLRRNPIKQKQEKLKYIENNRDKVLTAYKESHQKNRERNNKRAKDYYQRTKERRQALARQWKLDNRALATATENIRRAKKLSATPDWLTAEHKVEISNIYKNCPKGHEIDHIVPLQSKKVCGLHVPWNLEAIPTNDNRVKKNLWWPDMF